MANDCLRTALYIADRIENLFELKSINQSPKCVSLYSTQCCECCETCVVRVNQIKILPEFDRTFNKTLISIPT